MFEIGNSLREARLRQQLEFPELEQSTKIRGKYLRALEDERFDVLPAETYVKGFLRTYAEYLGLDGQLYVDEFNSRYVTGEDEPPVRPRRSTARPKPDRRVESSVVLVTLVGIAVLTALIIAAPKFGGSGGKSSIPNLGKTQAGSKTAVQRTKHVRKHGSGRPAIARVLITATRGSCWLQVHVGSATGRQQFAGTLDQGKSLPVKGRRLWIDAGAPENIDLKVNGRPRQLVSGSGPQVFVVTAKRVIPARAGA